MQKPIFYNEEDVIVPMGMMQHANTRQDKVVKAESFGNEPLEAMPMAQTSCSELKGPVAANNFSNSTLASRDDLSFCQDSLPTLSR